MSILRRFTDFVLQGRIQACATAFILAYLPLIGSVGVLIAALVTLRKGALEGALVFIAATVPYVLSYFSGAQPSDTMAIDLSLIAIVIVIASNFLMWLFAVMLKRYSSWGFILDSAVLLGVLVIGMAHLLYPEISDWWSIQLTTYFNKTAAIMQDMQANARVIPADVQVQMVNAIKLYATGLLAASIMFNALLQLLIARWWQAIMFNPGELRKELLSIRLSYVAGLLFLIFYPLSSFGNEIATDIMPVVLLMFGAAGLSLVHCILSQKTRLVWLILFYVGTIGFMLYPGGISLIALVFSMIAFFDIGLNFRKRFAINT